ncbi:hypothetical protein [uncultured Alistipes sp.]|uniref:hypothetical protein n=1 Tax=uncultured Alistipes sp. TaxID=538949 RepID=UPI002623640B|nr:hypothetical protein [uncultured Alistipes sp.]
MGEVSDFLMTALWVSASLTAAWGAGWLASSWRRYRFSAWWLAAAVPLLAAPVLLFPLCAGLRVAATRRAGGSECERRRNLRYRRLSLAMTVCFVVSGAVLRVLLQGAVPGVQHLAALSFVAASATTAVAAVCVLAAGETSA